MPILPSFAEFLISFFFADKCRGFHKCFMYTKFLGGSHFHIHFPDSGSIFEFSGIHILKEEEKCYPIGTMTFQQAMEGKSFGV